MKQIPMFRVVALVDARGSPMAIKLHEWAGDLWLARDPRRLARNLREREITLTALPEPAKPKRRKRA